MNTMTKLAVSVMANVRQPSPDWDVVGIRGMNTVAGWVLAFVLVAALIAVLVGAGMVLFGKFGRNQDIFQRGLIIVGCAVAGAAIGSSAAMLVNLGAGLAL
ncbi:hypothetical protein [Pseudactinotalea sp. Z1748]|uniref:hypothetical protein n=1 Tax=Pseudactinotalea sp. Z1748 TaxID=3413027 RepID=UPI003C7E0DB0